MRDSLPESRLRLTRHVVFVGLMGAGKTAIGRALAARLSVELRDSDAAIVERARMSIAEIFDRDGEAFFRAREAEVIRSLLDDPPCVLSTGGGAWLTAENRAALSATSAVVWLDADLDLLWHRVKHKDTRPLLRTEDPKATLAALLDARAPVYAMAEYRLIVRRSWSIAQTTDRVLALLTEAGVVIDETVA